MRLIEKEQTQKIKDDAEIAENMVAYNEDCNTLPGYKMKYSKQTNNDPSKPDVIYAANGDIFNNTSNLLNEVVPSATSNNVANTTFLSPRKKRSKSNVKQKKNKTQDNMLSNLSTTVLQLTSTNLGSMQNSETLVTSTADVNKIIPKQEKPDGITIGDEQYQIYLLES